MLGCGVEFSQTKDDIDILSESVRECYLRHLEGRLRDNVNVWRQNAKPPLADCAVESRIEACIAQQDQKAIRAACIRLIYQKFMAKLIKELQADTQRCQLSAVLWEQMRKVDTPTESQTIKKEKNSPMSTRTENKSTQTERDSTDPPTFNERIAIFQSQLDSRGTTSNLPTTQKHRSGSTERQRRKIAKSKLKRDTASTKTESESGTPPKKIKHNYVDENAEEDEVAREMELMFNGTGEMGTPRSDCTPIENVKQKLKLHLTKSPTLIDSEIGRSHHRCSEPPCKTEAVDLNKSIWPCEAYMRRHKLTASLSRLLLHNERWSEVIKWKFKEVFGEDSGDEFVISSPSVDMNEVIINSSILRITPWIVKHLMGPYAQGMIAHRQLFKKLAQKLAYNIIMQNQYPDELLVKRAIQDFFRFQTQVNSTEDIKSANFVFIPAPQY